MSQIKTTTFTITDKTHAFAQVNAMWYRDAAGQPWKKFKSGPTLSTTLFCVHLSGHEAAAAIKAARNTHPVWEAKVTKKVTYWDSEKPPQDRLTTTPPID